MNNIQHKLINWGDYLGEKCPIAVKIGLRLLVNYLLTLLLPVYLFLVYMSHNSLFSYDFFSSGKFGMTTFFYLITAFIIYFVILLALPAYHLHQIRTSPKTISSWFQFVLFMAVNVFLYYLLYNHGDKLLFWGILIPGLILLVVTVLAFEATIKNYLIALGVSAAILTVLPIINTEATSRVIGLSLKNFGVGGNIPVIIHSLSDEQSYKGQLVLLSPNAIFVRNTQDNLIVFERNSDIFIELINTNKKKKT